MSEPEKPFDDTQEAEPHRMYLGDGAYVERYGDNYDVYTRDGVLKANTVVLGTEEIYCLCRFVASKHRYILERVLNETTPQ